MGAYFFLYFCKVLHLLHFLVSQLHLSFLVKPKQEHIGVGQQPIAFNVCQGRGVVTDVY